jgi:DNA-binding MarR family transcriptional regulator
MTQSLENLLALTDTHLTQLMIQIKQEVFATSGMEELTSTQIIYLHAVHQLKHPTLTALAETFQITKPSATGLVQKLLHLGYLQKSQSGTDRRIFRLELTPKGFAVVQIKADTFRRFADQVRATLPPTEVNELERLLAKALEPEEIEKPAKILE